MARPELWIGCVAAGFCGTAATQAAEVVSPDLELLEYLGSWQGSDEEWLAVIDWRGDDQAQTDRQRRAAPPVDGAEENDDDADRKSVV